MNPERDRKILKEPELVVAVSAVVISVVAVVVALYEANIAREAQRSSVWPYVELLSTNVDGFILHAQNKGVGPARVGDVRVRLNGEPVLLWRDLTEMLDPDYGWEFAQSTINGRVISPGERIDYLKLTEASKQHAATTGPIDLDIQMCYCSVFDECWVTRGLDSQPVERCTHDAELSFQH